jgi:hypothetical protein
VIKGSGDITMTCKAPLTNITGYARVADVSSTGTVNTGVRIPIYLSSDSIPATEPVTPSPTPTTKPITTQPTTPPTTKPTSKVTYTPMSILVSLAGLGLIPLIRRMKK